MLLNNAALLDAIETALIEANDAFKGWPELAAAALRAVADAGFVIVPREPTEAMLKAGGDYQDRCAVLNYGSPADVEGVYLAMIRAAIAAALKEMGAG